MLKSPDTSTSPVVRRVRKLNKFALASQATFIAPGDNDTTDDGDGDISALKVKRKKITGRHFIDSEAELSGNDSGDDEEGSQEHYDESFVDDATQATDHGVYLRSLMETRFSLYLNTFGKGRLQKKWGSLKPPWSSHDCLVQPTCHAVWST